MDDAKWLVKCKKCVLTARKITQIIVCYWYTISWDPAGFYRVQLLSFKLSGNQWRKHISKKHETIPLILWILALNIHYQAVIYLLCGNYKISFNHWKPLVLTFWINVQTSTLKLFQCIFTVPSCNIVKLFLLHVTHQTLLIGCYFCDRKQWAQFKMYTSALWTNHVFSHLYWLLVMQLWKLNLNEMSL